MASQSSSDSTDDLAEDFGFSNFFTHLLATKKCIDVTFVLQEQDSEVEFFAHQLVLAMFSTFFADKFYGDQKDKKHQIIRLEKVDPKAFEDMIRYCYGYKPPLETVSEISALLRTASQFEIKNLINLCHMYLRDKEIKPENVFSMLEASECVQDENLMHMCYRFLENNTDYIIAAYDLRDITPAMVQNIIDLQKLYLNSEYELIRWIFDWAKVKSEEVSARKSAREYLEKFLKALNFLVLTFKEFAKLCKEHPDFLTSDEIASIFLNLAFFGSREMPSWHDKSRKLREYSGKELDTEIENTSKLLTKKAGWTETMEDCGRLIFIMENLMDRFCTNMHIEFKWDILENTIGKLEKLLEMLVKRDNDVENFRKTVKELFDDVQELKTRYDIANYMDLFLAAFAAAHSAKDIIFVLKLNVISKVRRGRGILGAINYELDVKRGELNDEIEKVQKKLSRLRNRKLGILQSE